MQRGQKLWTRLKEWIVYGTSIAKEEVAIFNV
jgi:hypothetical protein